MISDRNIRHKCRSEERNGSQAQEEDGKKREKERGSEGREGGRQKANANLYLAFSSVSSLGSSDTSFTSCSMMSGRVRLKRRQHITQSATVNITLVLPVHTHTRTHSVHLHYHRSKLAGSIKHHTIPYMFIRRMFGNKLTNQGVSCSLSCILAAHHLHQVSHSMCSPTVYVYTTCSML